MATTFPYEAWLRDIGIQLTLAQKRACRYLLRNGQEFLGDFGYENAAEKARALRRRKRAHKRK